MNYVNIFYRCKNTDFAFWYPTNRGSLSQKYICIVTLTYIISILFENGRFFGEILSRSNYLVVWPRPSGSLYWIYWPIPLNRLTLGEFHHKIYQFRSKSNLNELECFSLKNGTSVLESFCGGSSLIFWGIRWDIILGQKLQKITYNRYNYYGSMGNIGNMHFRVIQEYLCTEELMVIYYFFHFNLF